MTTEIERLAADIKTDEKLLEEAKGLGTDTDAIVTWANERGYDFSIEELDSHIEEQTAQLSEDELNDVAGGLLIAKGFPVSDTSFLVQDSAAQAAGNAVGFARAIGIFMMRAV